MSNTDETKTVLSEQNTNMDNALKSQSKLGSILLAASAGSANSFTCSQEDFDKLMSYLSSEQKNALQFTSSNGLVHVVVSPSSKKEKTQEKKAPAKKDEIYEQTSEEKMDDQLDKKRKEKKKTNKKNNKLKQKKVTKIKDEAFERANKMDNFLNRSKKLSSAKEAIARIGQKKLFGNSSKVLAKSAAKTTAKATSKILGKATLKSLVKKIPVVSLAAGCVFAYQRVKDGDWKGAIGEVTSGALGCVPGVGTAASVVVDAGLATRDIYNERQTPSDNSTEVQTPQIVPQQLRHDIDQRGIVEKTSDKTAQQPLSIDKTSLLHKLSENSR